jgi:hypothetical protein
MADEEPRKPKILGDPAPYIRTAGAIVTAILVNDNSLLVNLLSELTHEELIGVIFFLACEVADGVHVLSEISGGDPLEIWRHTLLLSEQEMM